MTERALWVYAHAEASAGAPRAWGGDGLKNDTNLPMKPDDIEFDALHCLLCSFSKPVS